MIIEQNWRPNLYDNYGVPDNYTDDTFLKQLRKNVKLNYVTLMEAISLSASIIIKMHVVILFVIIFIFLSNESIAPRFTFVLSANVTITGYLIYNIKIYNTFSRLTNDIRTALIFLAFGYILAPVLKTLTESISTDTIYAMTILMFLIHLIFSEYGARQMSLSDSLSITSSLFGSLMLASRLISPLHAFTLLTISVQCFVLLPFLLYHMRYKTYVSVPLASGTIYTLSFLSKTNSYVLIATTIFIHFLCPYWYIRCQKYKDNIYGPWDEAEIKSCIT